jgi:hypothetical protein
MFCQENTTRPFAVWARLLGYQPRLHECYETRGYGQSLPLLSSFRINEYMVHQIVPIKTRFSSRKTTTIHVLHPRAQVEGITDLRWSSPQGRFTETSSIPLSALFPGGAFQGQKDIQIWSKVLEIFDCFPGKMSWICPQGFANKIWQKKSSDSPA